MKRQFLTFYFLLFVVGVSAQKLTNGDLSLWVNPANASVTAAYKGVKWQQAPHPEAFPLRNAQFGPDFCCGELTDASGTVVGTVEIRIETDKPEFTVTTCVDPDYGKEQFLYPYPFRVSADEHLILAYREGLRIPCNDAYVLGNKLRRMEYTFTEGHNYNMPWWGIQRADDSGLIAVAETPYDARIRWMKVAGLWSASVNWVRTMGKFGDPRTVRYAFFDRGGYVAQCDYFRKWAEAHGFVRTLREKLADIPATDLAVGGPVIYIMTDNGQPIDDSDIVNAFIRGGVDRGTFYGGGGWFANMSPKCIDKVNKKGFVTSRYDILTDFVPEADISQVNVNPNWPRRVAVDEAVLDADGKRLRNWPVKARDGSTYKTYSMCDLRMKHHLRKIDDDLTRKNYTGRLIDVLGAVEVKECYDPKHPATRKESMEARSELLGLLYERGSVVGTEAGNMFMLKNSHIFEGLRSVHPLTMHTRLKEENPEQAHTMWEAGAILRGDELEMLLLSQRYIAPIWQLTFGDCVISYLRWNQQTNRYLDREWVTTHELFSILTGQPAMIAVPIGMWDRYARPVIRMTKRIYDPNQEVRYARMTGHGCLDGDGDVQYSDFDNGVRILVNFSQEPFAYDSRTVGARDYIIEKQ